MILAPRRLREVDYVFQVSQDYMAKFFLEKLDVGAEAQ